MRQGQVAAVILAAGKSTRFAGEMPKVLCELHGRPLLTYVIEACQQAGATRLIVVVGYGKDQVIEMFGEWPGCVFVEQTEQKGTAHAVLCCRQALADVVGQVLVLAGDMPLVRGRTLRALLAENARTGDPLTLATTILDDPTGYGRIVRSQDDRVIAIVEQNDCTESQRAIREVNPSYYCFDSRFLFPTLEQIGNDNAKGEHYITDAVSLLVEQGHRVGAIPAVAAQDALGINSREDLALVATVMEQRCRQG